MRRLVVEVLSADHAIMFFSRLWNIVLISIYIRHPAPHCFSDIIFLMDISLIIICLMLIEHIVLSCDRIFFNHFIKSINNHLLFHGCDFIAM